MLHPTDPHGRGPASCLRDARDDLSDWLAPKPEELLLVSSERERASEALGACIHQWKVARHDALSTSIRRPWQKVGWVWATSSVWRDDK